MDPWTKLRIKYKNQMYDPWTKLRASQKIKLLWLYRSLFTKWGLKFEVVIFKVAIYELTEVLVLLIMSHNPVKTVLDWCYVTTSIPNSYVPLCVALNALNWCSTILQWCCIIINPSRISGLRSTTNTILCGQPLTHSCSHVTLISPPFCVTSS